MYSTLYCSKMVLIALLYTTYSFTAENLYSSWAERQELQKQWENCDSIEAASALIKSGKPLYLSGNPPLNALSSALCFHKHNFEYIKFLLENYPYLVRHEGRPFSGMASYFPLVYIAKFFNSCEEKVHQKELINLVIKAGGSLFDTTEYGVNVLYGLQDMRDRKLLKWIKTRFYAHQKQQRHKRK